MWMDGHGTIKANPAYGTGINSFLLDTLNDHGLEQLLDEPTRNNHFLDLVLSTHPEIICDVTVVPGMSDHEATIKYNTSLYKKSSHKVCLFHKGNLTAIRDILKFQESFNLSDPYSNSVNNNWINFKMTLIESIQKHTLRRM